MYTYYFLASFGPRFKPFLWWKKYLTAAQIYQHVAIISHGLVPIFYDCGYPRFFIYLGAPQGILGLCLFINFYAIEYSAKQKKARLAAEAAAAMKHAAIEAKDESEEDLKKPMKVDDEVRERRRHA